MKMIQRRRGPEMKAKPEGRFEDEKLTFIPGNPTAYLYTISMLIQKAQGLVTP